MAQIMTQAASWDPGTSIGSTETRVLLRSPTTHSLPITAPPSFKMQPLETFSYDELLSNLDCGAVHGNQHGILYHLSRRCITERDLGRGREIHSYAKRCGLASDVLLGSQFIQLYASHGNLVEAHEVFDGLLEPDLVSWTAIISAHATHGENHEAIRLYHQLQSLNIGLDGPVFMAALKACAGAAALEEGKLIHAHIIESGWEASTFVGNTIVDMYAKCGSLQEAALTFNRLMQHDVVAWNALLAGYSQLGYSQEALEVFKQMQAHNVALSHVSFVFVLKACMVLQALNVGEHIHTLVIEYGLNNDFSVCNTLIDMYANCGSMQDATVAFEKIETPDVVLWSTLIAAYGNAGHGHQALELFFKMQHDSVIPNEITYNSVLKACTNIAHFEEGKRVHSFVVACGLDSNVFLNSTLVDMYCKCGELDQACSVFDMSVKCDVSLWNAMIGGYAQHGLGQEALQIFCQLQQKGIEPNKITVMYVLKACSCVCALEQGRRVHAHIIRHGLLSDLQVGSTLIDMYGKCGTLQDAHVLFESLPKKDVAVWNIVIGGCSQHSNYNKAYAYFKAMQKAGFVPDDVTYLCLLAACSRLGLADEGLSQFKSLIRDYGIAPTTKLSVSIVDCVGRAGFLNEAEDLIECLPDGTEEAGWLSLLGSCRVHADVNVGRRCFNNIIKLNPANATAFVIMETLYWQAGMKEEAEKVSKWRGDVCAWKKPAKAFIEVNNVVHDFVVGDKTHPCSSKIYAKIKDITSHMKEEGCMTFPSLKISANSTLVDAAKNTDEDNLLGHCEKLAIVFGLISTPVGSTIRVSKNLRMCDDCHHATKFISRLELREIVVNDAFCVHHFKDGECSCKEYFDCHSMDC
ncbi:hypothetical protein GOP47_0027839 [Adiantum capillus-veneris]|nr:hypothetical protein GOP47_0027839 [Adiantum capillus-veneris]